MLKPSSALKEEWSRECKSSCSMYWISMKAMPFTRYESCVKKCFKKRIEQEKERIKYTEMPIKGSI